MKKSFVRTLSCLVLLLSVLILGAWNTADAAEGKFPQGNIIVTVGNAPGSGGDLLCRSIAQAVAGHPLLNGYSMVVENRTGASGATGTILGFYMSEEHIRTAHPTGPASRR